MTELAPATIVVSRHGETVWHAENRYAGSTDVALTDNGLREADRLGHWAAVARPDALYSSPISRALLTAAPVAQELGVQPVVLDDLREVHFGIAEGRTISEIRADTPEVADRFVADPVGGQFPEAESPTSAAERGARAFRRIAADNPGRTVLVVAHNTLFRVTLCGLLGIPLSTYRQVLPRLHTGTLSTISLAGTPGSATALLSFNVPLEAAMVAS